MLYLLLALAKHKGAVKLFAWADKKGDKKIKEKAVEGCPLNRLQISDESAFQAKDF